MLDKMNPFAKAELERQILIGYARRKERNPNESSETTISWLSIQYMYPVEMIRKLFKERGFYVEQNV